MGTMKAQQATSLEEDQGMNAPKLSAHFESRKPFAIRTAQIEFMKRTDGVAAVSGRWDNRYF